MIIESATAIKPNIDMKKKNLPSILKQIIQNTSVYGIFAVATLLLLYPYLSNPEFFLSRNNDLQEFFWPIIEYTKTGILSHNQIPLWYTTILSGTPLLPDPQSMIFYVPNIIFLFTDMSTGFLISTNFHIFLSGVGMYVLTQHALGFQKRNSIIAGLLYLFNPKFAGFLEAGHFGLITSWAWIPFAIYAALILTKRPSFKHTVLLSTMLALIFYSHILIFTSTLGAIFLIWLYSRRNINYFLLSLLILFGLTAIVFLPQISWAQDTTRSLLLSNPDTYPKWFRKLEFVETILVPWLEGAKNIQAMRSDKWIPLGLSLPILSLFGFLKLKSKLKIYLLIFALGLLILLLNNASPFFPILINLAPFQLLRVTTRLWFLAVIPIIILAAYALEKIKGFKKYTLVIIACFAIAESFFISNTYLNKPVPPREFAPPSVLEFLSQDEDLFRVFCLTRCISQRDAVQNNLELIEGYSTLTQDNYYQTAQLLTGRQWDYYSLATPPIGSYSLLKPNYKALGTHNTKYIISKNELENENLVEVSSDSGYRIYENLFFAPRSNGTITNYSPNNISIETSNLNTEEVTVANTFSNGWEYNFSEKEARATLSYSPTGYKLGKAITIITVALLLGCAVLFFVNPKILLIMFGLSMAFAATELGSRMLFQTSSLRWRDDPVVGRRFVPNQRGKFVTHSGEYETEVIINSQGWRDSEHTFVKPENVFRILILGDSFVENMQVPLEQTFFKQLEEDDIEVIAMGIGDTGTAQQLIALEQHGLQYDPDLVIHMFFTGNDVKNNSLALMHDPHRPYFELHNDELTQIPSTTRTSNLDGKIKSFIKNKSRFVEMLLRFRQQRSRSVDSSDYPIDYHVYDQEYSNQYAEAWETTKALILKSKEITNSSGAKYILVTLANNEQVHNEVWGDLQTTYPALKTANINLEKPDQVLKEFCLEEKLDCHFMLPIFKDYISSNAGAVTHYKFDGHWTKAGTDLVANFLSRILLFD